MPIQIANPDVVAKIEQLSRATGLGKTAAVDAAVSRMLTEMGTATLDDAWARVLGIVDQLHAVPPRADAFEAVQYDEHGLPE